MQRFHGLSPIVPTFTGSLRQADLGYVSIYQTLLAKVTSWGTSQAALTRAKWYHDTQG
jgi:hypothetical protein